jgi:tight adherence protein B
MTLMDFDDLLFFGLIAVAAICVVVVIYLLVAPYTTGERRADQRLAGVAEGVRKGTTKIQDAANNRKKQVADTLRDLEAKQAASKKVSLRQLLEQTGTKLDVKTFWIASGVCGALITLVVAMSAPNLNLLVVAGIGVAAALGLPRFIVGRMIASRHKKFLNEFANAIDIIVRGVKSGLPLNECLNIIARESPEPLCSEFREVVDQQRVGVPLQQCFERMMERVPLAEVRFFGIVIGIQQSAGGNLSEALGNLSGVLRDRKSMAAKVQALSAEAKASAAVLGSLPFIVMILVYITTPDYIALLWQKTYGQFMLLASAFWMSCGLLMMRKMINFKF